MPDINLTAVRGQMKLSQVELAQKMGVTQQTISSWEQGRSEPSATQLQELSRLAGISADRILCGKN